jgi:hypothetical protein
MKTWTELTEDEKERVRKKLINDQLTFLTEIGPNYFHPDQSDLRAAATAAFEEAENMKTPWFAHEYLWDNPLIQEYIKDYVEFIASEDILYLEPGEGNMRRMYIPWEGGSK